MIGLRRLVGFLVSSGAVVGSIQGQQPGGKPERLIDAIARSYPADKEGMAPSSDVFASACTILLPDSLVIIPDTARRLITGVNSWLGGRASGGPRWEHVFHVTGAVPDTLRAAVVGARCKLSEVEILLRSGRIVFGITSAAMVKRDDYDITNPRHASIFVPRSGRLIPAVSDQQSAYSTPTRIVDLETYLAEKGTLGGRLSGKGVSSTRSLRLIDRIQEDYPSIRVRAVPTTEQRYAKDCPNVPYPDSIAIVLDDRSRKSFDLSTWQSPQFGKDTSEWRTFISLSALGQAPDTILARAVGIRCDFGGAQLLLQVDNMYIGVGLSSLLHVYGWDDPVDVIEPAIFVIREGKLSGAVYQEPLGTADAPTRVTDTRILLRDKNANVASARADRIRRIRAKAWSSRITNAVIAGNVWIGMTAEMVRLSWGSPNQVNKTITQSASVEQWVYDGQYVYLRNGVVSAIQTSH